MGGAPSGRDLAGCIRGGRDGAGIIDGFHEKPDDPAVLDRLALPPELREDRTWLGGDPPQLIELEDIRAELHAHTTASDGSLDQ